MAVYVDNERIPWRGKIWCHLVADTLDELHAFAASLGLKRSWFQGHASYPHYDVTMSMRERALERGAVRVGKTEMLNSARKLRAELAALHVGVHPLTPPPVHAAQQHALLPLF